MDILLSNYIISTYTRRRMHIWGMLQLNTEVFMLPLLLSLSVIREQFYIFVAI